MNEEKYKQLKKRLKDVLEENDRLVSRLKKAKLTIQVLKAEKNLLLDKVAELTELSDSEDDNDSQDDDSDDDVLNEEGLLPPVELPPGSYYPPPSHHHHGHPPHGNHPHDENTPKRRHGSGRETSLDALESSTPFHHNGEDPASSAELEGSGGKRKRRKLDKVHPVQEIQRDEKGLPIFPVNFGIITLHSLGSVVHDRPGFHSERYIYPIGFTTSREYYSMIDPNKKVRYTCTVLDGELKPKFMVQPEDQAEPIISSSATGAWTTVLKAVNKVRGRDSSNAAAGPDYFGFSYPPIMRLIQELPNADKCTNYTWLKFEIVTGKKNKRPGRRSEFFNPNIPSSFVDGEEANGDEGHDVNAVNGNPDENGYSVSQTLKDTPVASPKVVKVTHETTHPSPVPKSQQPLINPDRVESGPEDQDGEMAVDA